MNSLKFCDVPYPHILQKKLFDMQQSRRMCDLVLLVENTEIHVHKLVLSAVSPYFSALENFKENKDQKIEFRDISKTALEAIVRFLYTGEIEITNEHKYEIMSAANFFQVFSLKLPISHFLISTVNSKNCMEMLAFADLYAYEEVFYEILRFIAENMHFVVTREAFLQAPAHIIKQILCNRGLDLNNILKALVKWMKYNGCLTEFSFSGEITTKSLEETYNCIIEENPEFIDILSLVFDFIKKYYKDKNNKILKIGQQLKENQVILAIGGLSNNTVHASIEAYSTSWSYSLPTSHYDTISVIPTMKTARMCFAVTQPLRRPEVVYVLGGYCVNSRCQALASCEKYDAEKNQWSQLKEMPKKVTRHAAAWVEEKVVVTGGLGIEGEAVRDVWEYLEKESVWRSSIPLTDVRADHAAINIMGTLYVLGGQGGKYGRLLATVERFNSALSTWTRVSDMPEPKSEFGCVAINEFIYVMGGASEHFITTTCHRYNTITDKWEACADIPTPKSRFGCTVKNGKIYCVGGSDITHGPLGGVDIYNPETNRWSFSTDNLLTPRANARAVTINLYLEENIMCN